MFIVAFRPIIYKYLAMLQSYIFLAIEEKFLSTKLNETPGWIGIARLSKVEWLLRAFNLLR